MCLPNKGKSCSFIEALTAIDFNELIAKVYANKASRVTAVCGLAPHEALFHCTIKALEILLQNQTGMNEMN